MNEPELKSAAFALAEATPRHLDQPTTPPIHWNLEGAILRVLLADGRTVRAVYPIPALTPGPSPKKIGEGKTMGEMTHAVSDLIPSKSPANPQRTGTRHKAGK